MPNKTKYRLDYCPETYWGDPVKTLLANIKGEHRRQHILTKLKQGRISEVPVSLIAENLSNDERDLAGTIHPGLMGGEYLPDAEKT